MNNYLFIGIMAVLIVIIGAFFALSCNFTEDVKIDILGNGEIEEGGSIHIKLTSKNGTPLEDKEINITILNKKGNSLAQFPSHALKTDSNGKISFSDENLTKGEYIVKVTFGGDDKYSANETTKKIKVIEKKVVKKKVVEKTPQETASAPETSDATSEVSEPTSTSDEVDFGTFYDDEGRVYEYEDRGGYYNVLDEDGYGVSIDYDGNIIGTYSLYDPIE